MSRAAQVLLGSVVSVWRYPVKSMKGEELNVADITEAGLLGDRAYALLDTSTGKVASAKNPRKWAKLLEFQATFAQPARSRKKIPPVRIRFRMAPSLAASRATLIRFSQAFSGATSDSSRCRPRQPNSRSIGRT